MKYAHIENFLSRQKREISIKQKHMNEKHILNRHQYLKNTIIIQ